MVPPPLAVNANDIPIDDQPPEDDCVNVVVVFEDTESWYSPPSLKVDGIVSMAVHDPQPQALMAWSGAA